MTHSIRRIESEAAGFKICWSDMEDFVSYVWLRDHARDSVNFDASTHQRNFYTGGMNLDIAPLEWRYHKEESQLEVVWPDQSEPIHYCEKLLGEHRTDWAPPIPGSLRSATKPWAQPAVHSSLDYAAALSGGGRELLGQIQRNGFAMVRGCPIDTDAVARVAKSIGYVRETLFGGVWSFEANQKMADSAYSNDELRPHTDGTYSLDAPGLQLLLCLQQAPEGGESVLVDGFAIAETLRIESPEKFMALTQIPVPGIYKGDGRTLRASRPIIQLDQAGSVTQVSFNSYDRDVLRLPLATERQLYEGMIAFEQLANDADRQWCETAQAGDMLVFDNWRMLHGRKAFLGSRKMAGCYINREDYLSAIELSASEVRTSGLSEVRGAG